MMSFMTYFFLGAASYLVALISSSQIVYWCTKNYYQARARYKRN